MNRKDVYIYFSGATDVTGNKLKDALKITGGNTKPKNKKLVIGWGSKTKTSVTFTKTTKVLNHPDSIRINRNKFKALNTMAKSLNTDNQVHIAVPIPADEIKNAIINNEINYPVIGRTKYHQGGKGFWNCPTVAQLDNAIANGAHHFQTILPIKEEFRLHVFNGKVIHAVKKVQRTEKGFKKAWIDDELNRQKAYWNKNNKGGFNEEQAKEMLRRQANDAVAGGPNMLLRSNKMGWKFSIVTKYPKNLVSVAIKALDALKLDFGAVDCCVDVNGNPWVFEVNTGPGLEGTSLDKYVEAFNEVIDAGTKQDKQNKTIKKTTIKNKETTSERDFMKMQLNRLQNILDETDDADLNTVKTLGARLIFGGQ